MGKSELDRKYELMVVLDAKLSNDEKETTFKALTESVTKGGGKIVNSQVWLDKHKFTFKMNKATEGTYYLINFEAPSKVVPTIETSLKLNEKILRSLTSKVD